MILKIIQITNIFDWHALQSKLRLGALSFRFNPIHEAAT